MKLFANKKLFKKIVILLVFITLVNALIPLHMVSAGFGGKLFKPMFEFIAAVFDLSIRALQDIFIGTGDIKSNAGKYQIRYSPGVIFSNKVPGLDANFINPGPSKSVIEQRFKKVYGDNNSTVYTYLNGPTASTDSLNENYGFNIDFSKIESGNFENIYWWTDSGAGDRLMIVSNNFELDSEEITNDEYQAITNSGESKDFKELKIFNGSEGATFSVNSKKLAELMKSKPWVLYSTDGSTGEVKKSTAAQLQVTVSKWYKALRLVSLVALLSVLVYVGIRIIISSTGQEKAKYKKMIGDWVAAICILFVLNYIMAFTMDIVNRIINVFASSNLIDANGVDILMSDIRFNIEDGQYSNLTSFTYLILYIVLVIYTIIFTVHYLKRVVYLAFFTMIAPLIAVTYPIDRIKDGQAQAFGTWMKEYTFNAAIPVIHIIIYSALVGSAPELAESNPLYAIVCISFLIPAEKFFKKLFGFEKATTVGQLGAAAGGALIMNAINKMGAKSGKQAAAKAGASAAPRTSGGSGYIAAPGEAPTGGGSTPPGGALGGTGGTGGAGTSGGGGMPTDSAFGQSINTHHTRPVGAKGGNIAGLKNVRGRYINKNTAKNLGRLARKVAIGGAGAYIGANVGLLGGALTGDLSNAFKGVALGAGAGFSGLNYLGDKAMSAGGNIKGSFQEGKWGTDEYNTRNQIKELSNDQEFNKTCKSLGYNGKQKEEAIRMFNNNGITNSEDIKKMMNIQAKTGASQSEIIAVQKIRKQADKDKLKTKEIRANLASSGLSGSDVDRAMNLIDML